MDPSAERIIDLYQRLAERYIVDRGESLGAERTWLTRYADRLAPGARVLDLGCGFAGPIASYLIARGFMLTGVDSADRLIAEARRRHPAHRWHCADMRTLALAQRFDGLLAWDSFFHLGHADQRRMFSVFGKHAAAGALLMFTSGPAHGEALGCYHGETLYHASLDPGEYRQRLLEAGFEVLDHRAEDPLAGGRTVWLAQRVG